VRSACWRPLSRTCGAPRAVSLAVEGRGGLDSARAARGDSASFVWRFGEVQDMLDLCELQ